MGYSKYTWNSYTCTDKNRSNTHELQFSTGKRKQGRGGLVVTAGLNEAFSLHQTPFICLENYINYETLRTTDCDVTSCPFSIKIKTSWVPQFYPAAALASSLPPSY